MKIITSKTDEAIRKQFDRRGFLRLAASSGVGLTIYSTIGTVRVAAMPIGIAAPAGFVGVWSNFKDFVLNIGMQFAGYKLNQAFGRYPALQTGFNNFMRGASGYNPLQNWDMISGMGRTFVPLQNPNGLFMSPFFFPSNGQLGSPINWWSNVALPQVNDILSNDNLSQSSRARYLLPVSPRQRSYNNVELPERYNTEPGSTEFAHKGDERSGEVDYKIFVKRKGGTLEELESHGTLGVELQA